MKLKENYDLIILDTGVDVSHPSLCKYKDIDCVRFDPITKKIVSMEGDVFGHATALADIIKKRNPETSILSICIFFF